MSQPTAPLIKIRTFPGAQFAYHQGVLYRREVVCFTSNEPLRPGDAFIGELDGLWVVKRIPSNFPSGLKPLPGQRVVATNDPSLGLPLIPASFLVDFAEQEGRIQSLLDWVPNAKSGQPLFSYRRPDGRVVFDNLIVPVPAEETI